MEIGRREFTRKEALKLGLLASAALVLPAERVARTQLSISNRLPTSRLPKPFTLPFAVPPILQPVRSDETTDYYELTMRKAAVEILPSKQTEVFGYNGVTPGPTIHARKGRPAVVRHINDLPKFGPWEHENWTSVHLHGSDSLPQYDGYASDIIRPGEFKDYHYPNDQDARTLWYHDHGMHITAQNAYMGCAAMYHLHDDVEQGLPIPRGHYDANGNFVPSKYDVPLILRDAIFSKKGALIFDDEGHSGLYGDVILTNGVPWPVMKVERRKYRFRVLNGSLSRGYNISLSTGEPMTVIGHEGGLAPHPVDVGKMRIGMGERYEIVIDFSKYKVGQKVVLKNSELKNNEDFPSTRQIMRFDVVGDATDTSNNEVPEDLNPNMHVMGLKESDATNAANPTQIEVIRKHGMWTVNGQIWDDVVKSNYQKVVANPGLNEVQVWELINKSGGWNHPVHLHMVDFKILSREGGPNKVLPYEQGPKDVAYVGEGEKVKVIAKFGPRSGRYMLHCHNLVHEDHDMMVQFKVGSGSDPDPHPVNAAPAKPVSEMTPL